MKRIFKPFIQMAHNAFEQKTMAKAPRGKSKKVRKYEHVDVAKAF